MELLIIIALVLLNGVFSMSEMALVSARKFKLEAAKKAGSKGAKTALQLAENPNRFFSTVQIGITLIGVLLGIYSGDKLTQQVETFLASFEVIRPFAHNLAVGAIVVFITYLSIVLGELFPKRVGLTFPESIIIKLARPMALLSKITSPFVWLLTVTNDLLVKLLGIDDTTENKVSEEEIKSIIKDSAEGGEIQEVEHEIVERVFEMGDRKVKSLMTHRSDIVWFEENDSLAIIREKVHAEKHSAYPVCRNHNVDEVIGMVLIKDLFAPNLEKDFHLKYYLTKPIFISENMQAYRLLELFKREKYHYAILVDEYGSTKGIITLDDLIDALVGDISDAHQEEYAIVQRDENSWLVDGQYPLLDFLKYFEIEMDKKIYGEFVTVSGLFIAKLKALPSVGERISVEGYELEVIDKDHNRIDKIMVKKLL